MDQRLDDIPEAIRRYVPKARQQANGQRPPRGPQQQPPQQAAPHAPQQGQYPWPSQPVQQAQPPAPAQAPQDEPPPAQSEMEPRHDDPTDAAGMALLALLQQAARTTEESRDNAVSLAERLSAELRAVEDRMAQLTAALEHYRGRAEHAEQWLKQIQLEIEQKLIAPQAAVRNPTH
jgi:hypothetical protein